MAAQARPLWRRRPVPPPKILRQVSNKRFK
jgi:hypothetical protein